MKRLIQWGVLSLSMISFFGCSSIRNNILVPSQLPKEDKIAEELEKKYLSYDKYEIKKYDQNGNELSSEWKDSEVKVYQDKFEKYLDEGFTSKNKEELKIRRNAIIGNLVILLNIRYSQYERAFYNVDASLGTAFDITTLAVTATGAVAGGSETKSILSAVAAGLTGSKLSLEKNFLYEKTSPVLIAQMRQLRKEKLKVIMANMNREIVGSSEKTTNEGVDKPTDKVVKTATDESADKATDNVVKTATNESEKKATDKVVKTATDEGVINAADGYSLEQGLIDVQDYFSRGTIIGALQAMSDQIVKPAALDMKASIQEIKDLHALMMKKEPESAAGSSK